MVDRELAARLRGKVAVVGVGNSGHGDDAVGPLVVELLAEAGYGRVMDSGAHPELDTWKLREMNPDVILFVDAVDFGGKPGDVCILERESLRTEGYDTHRAPLKLTMDYLEQELGCRCVLLAVQPKDVRQGAAMCKDVRESGESLARILGLMLARSDTPNGGVRRLGARASFRTGD